MKKLNYEVAYIDSKSHWRKLEVRGGCSTERRVRLHQALKLGEEPHGRGGGVTDLHGWTLEYETGEGKRAQEIVSQTVGWKRSFRKVNGWKKSCLKPG